MKEERAVVKRKKYLTIQGTYVKCNGNFAGATFVKHACIVRYIKSSRYESLLSIASIISVAEKKVEAFPTIETIAARC